MRALSSPAHPHFISAQHDRVNRDRKGDVDGMGRSDSWGPEERVGAAVFSASVLAAVLSPLLQYRRPWPLDRWQRAFGCVEHPAVPVGQ